MIDKISKKECDAYKCIDLPEGRLRIRKNYQLENKPYIDKQRGCAMEGRDRLHGFICKICSEKLKLNK